MSKIDTIVYRIMKDINEAYKQLQKEMPLLTRNYESEEKTGDLGAAAFFVNRSSQRLAFLADMLEYLLEGDDTFGEIPLEHLAKED